MFHTKNQLCTITVHFKSFSVLVHYGGCVVRDISKKYITLELVTLYTPSDAYRLNTTISLLPEQEPKLPFPSHATNKQTMAPAFRVTKASSS